MRNQRQQLILNILRNENECRVTDLAERCNVSTVTIRKDVQQLEDQGVLRRYHGKVVLASDLLQSVTLRSSESPEKKRSIARTAVDMLQNYRSVALDSGTTTTAIARELRQRGSQLNPLNIVTNSLPVAQNLVPSYHTISIAGGILLSHSMCTAGPDAMNFLKGFRTDIAFIGATGLRPQDGLATNHRQEGEIKRALIATAHKVVAVLADDKFFADAFYCFAGFEQLDAIITTHGAEDSPALDYLLEKGVEVIFADDHYPLQGRKEDQTES